MSDEKGFLTAVKEVYTSKESWAVIGSSTLISAATSGASTLILKTATTSLMPVAKSTIKTVLVNVLTASADAAIKDISTKKIKGENQDIAETLSVTVEGGVNALIFSSVTEAFIAANSGQAFGL